MSSERNANARRAILRRDSRSDHDPADDKTVGAEDQGYETDGSDVTSEVSFRDIDELSDRTDDLLRMDPDGTEQGGQPQLFTEEPSGLDQGIEGSTGQGEHRGRSMFDRVPKVAGPTIPPPDLNWGPGRGVDAGRSQGQAGRGRFDRDRGIGRRDEPSARGGRRDVAPQQAGQKRRNESEHGQGRETKALKILDTSDRSAQLFRPGGIQAVRGGLTDTVTDTKLLAGGANTPNYFGQFVGGASDAYAAKTEGKTLDAAASVAGAYNSALDRSASKEVLTVCMPINRVGGPNSSTRLGQSGNTSQARPENLRIQGSKGKQKWPKNYGSSSRSASPAPWKLAGRQGAGTAAGTGQTAGQTAGDKGKRKEAETIDLTQSQHVDLTESNDELNCDICRQAGTHTTGRCASVTSMAHGDTNTDPFCNWSASATRPRVGQQAHALQGPQKHGKFTVTCARLDSHWAYYDIFHLMRTMVIERRRMPPLAVHTECFCFIELTLRYAEKYCPNQLPPEMEGLWPYTKADAVKYADQCEQFWILGIGKMPPGELEGLTFAQVRDSYNAGRIPPQIRYVRGENKKIAVTPLTGIAAVAEKEKIPGTIDDTGDMVMGGQTSTSQDIPVPGDGGEAAPKSSKGRIKRTGFSTLKVPPKKATEAEDAVGTTRRGKKVAAVAEMDEENDAAEAAAEHEAELLAKRKSLKGRITRTGLSTAAVQAANRKAEAVTRKPAKATETRVQPDGSHAVPTSAPEGGQDTAPGTSANDTLMAGTLEAEAAKGKPDYGVEDIIGIVKGWEDIPEPFADAWREAFMQNRISNVPVLLNMYKAIENADKEGTETITQTVIFESVAAVKEVGLLPLNMAEAWAKCTEMWYLENHE